MIQRVSWIHLSAGWALLILILSVMPGQSLPSWKFSDMLSIDKLAHAFVYAVLGVFLIFTVTRQYAVKLSRSLLVLMVIIVTVMYGILLEGLQAWFLKDRYFEIPDIFANIIGSLFGTIGARYFLLSNK